MSQLGVQSTRPLPPEQDGPPTLESLVSDPKYADMSHADIAADLNGQTMDVTRATVTVKEILATLDASEIAGLTHPGFWKILESSEFDVAGNEVSLLSEMLPPTSLKAFQAYVASAKSVPLWAHMGMNRPFDYGDVSMILGFEPDVFDATTGENQNGAGLTPAKKAEILAANAQADVKTLVNGYTKRQLDVLASLSPDVLTASRVNASVIDDAKALQAAINTFAKANSGMNVTDLTHADVIARVNS